MENIVSHLVTEIDSDINNISKFLKILPVLISKCFALLKPVTKTGRSHRSKVVTTLLLEVISKALPGKLSELEIKVVKDLLPEAVAEVDKVLHYKCFKLCTGHR